MFEYDVRESLDTEFELLRARGRRGKPRGNLAYVHCTPILINMRARILIARNNIRHERLHEAVMSRRRCRNQSVRDRSARGNR